MGPGIFFLQNALPAKVEVGPGPFHKVASLQNEQKKKHFVVALRPPILYGKFAGGLKHENEEEPDTKNQLIN